MKDYYARFYPQVKALEREKIKSSESYNNSDENTETDGNDESSAKEQDDSRFGFVRTVPDEAPAPNKYMQERKKRSNDAAVAKTEFEKASANWI